MAARQGEGRENAVTVSERLVRPRHGGFQVRHDERMTKDSRPSSQERLEARAVAQVQMEVVWPGNRIAALPSAAAAALPAASAGAAAILM